MLNTLYSYTTKWNLAVNVEKTEIVMFRNGGKIRSDEKWFLNVDNIRIADKFMYLRMLINYNGKFNDTQKQLSLHLQGRKAMFSLKFETNELYLNTETMFHYLIPTSEVCLIWGFFS
mgnify:CR=1 FL=1